jgi:hypothetical protein
MASEDEKWDRLTAWMESTSEGRWQRKDLQVEFREIPGKLVTIITHKRNPENDGFFQVREEASSRNRISP